MDGISMSYLETPGVIRDVAIRQLDLCQIPYLQIGFPGSSQAFGGITLKAEECFAFLRDLCAIFDVETQNDLLNQPCIAYRCFDDFSATIEALGSSAGRKLILADWCRTRYPKTQDPLEVARARLNEALAYHHRGTHTTTRQLAELDQRYHPIK